MKAPLQTWLLNSAKAELTERPCGLPEIPEIEDDCGADMQIEAEYRHRLWAVQFLPRRDRPAARYAARMERAYALLALKKKRDNERHWRRTLLRLRAPKPRG